jgi:crotonobetaine/carnitine-CoA ligase
VSGENVSVVEVEQVLAEHPDVHDVAVVGAQDAIRDEVPEAYIVARTAAGATSPPSSQIDRLERDLRDWAESHLSPSKRPRTYHFVGELPRTSVGKVRKFLLDPATSSAGSSTSSTSTRPTNEETDQ